MATTKFWLKDATTDESPGETELSVALPVGTFKDFAIAQKSMGTIKDGSETSISGTSLAQTAHQDNFFTSFTYNERLAAQTFGSGIWTLSVMVKQNNNVANSFIVLSLYVWRPSTSSVVGYIYDSDTPLGNEWNRGARGRVVTFTGSNVTCQAKDRLVLEFWRHAEQGKVASYTQELFYGGSTVPTEGATGDPGNSASKLDAPTSIVQWSEPLFPVMSY